MPHSKKKPMKKQAKEGLLRKRYPKGSKPMKRASRRGY